MTTYIALLRGINLGGRHRVPMAELRAIHEELGHDRIRTYVQSGNVVFGADRTDPDRLATEIQEALASRFDFGIPVVLRTHEQLAAVVADSPYADRDVDPRFVAVTFLDRPPDLDPAVAVDHGVFAPNEFVVHGREIHQFYPNGMARAKLPAALERALRGHVATTRNWRTVTTLLELSGPGA